MTSERDLIARIDRLESRLLHEWIEMGLVAPQRGDEGFEFDDIDVARVNLVCDLSFDLGIEQESLPVVLSLIDQLHRTRASLRAICAAIADQPDEVKTTVSVRLRATLFGADQG